MLDSETLRRLIEPTECALTIYLPLEPQQRDLRAPEARLRTLIDEADAMLQKDGIEDRTRATLLAPLHSYAESGALVEHRDPGLVFFIAEARSDIFPLPAALGPSVTNGRDFHIKPLLPFLASNRRFYILALSKTDLRLLAATPFTWQEITLDHLPIEAQAVLDSQEEAGGPLDPDLAIAERHALIIQSPSRVAAAVKAAIGIDTAPVILVADPQLSGHLLKQPDMERLVADSVALNPFSMSDQELHARIVETMRPMLSSELDAVLDQINARLGTAEPNVAINLEEILAAAQEGRVDTLVVAEDETLWGQDEPGKTLSAHGSRAPHDEDLLNCAVLRTLRTGGRAFALPHERMPRHVPAAALLRY